MYFAKKNGISIKKIKIQYANNLFHWTQYFEQSLILKKTNHSHLFKMYAITHYHKYANSLSWAWFKFKYIHNIYKLYLKSKIVMKKKITLLLHLNDFSDYELI